jgi:hypothetical protein
LQDAEVDTAEAASSDERITSSKTTPTGKEQVQDDLDQTQLTNSSGNDSSWLAGYDASMKVSTSFSSLLKIYFCEGSTSDSKSQEHEEDNAKALVNNSPLFNHETASGNMDHDEDNNTKALFDIPLSDSDTASVNVESLEERFEQMVENKVDSGDDDGLPYTVAEYRSSYKDVRVAGQLASPDTSDVSVWEHSHDVSTFSSPLPYSHDNVLLESALFKTPRALLSSTYIRYSKAERWSDPEDTIRRQPTMRCKFFNLSTTLPDLEDFTNTTDLEDFTSTTEGHGGEAAASNPSPYTIGDSTGSRSYRNEDITCNTNSTSTSLTEFSPRQSSTSHDQHDAMSRSCTSSFEKTEVNDLDDSSYARQFPCTPTRDMHTASRQAIGDSYYRHIGNTYDLKRVGQPRACALSDSETLDNASRQAFDGSHYRNLGNTYVLKRVGQPRAWTLSDSETLNDFKSPYPVDNYLAPAGRYSVRTGTSFEESSSRSGGSSGSTMPTSFSTASRPVSQCDTGEGSDNTSSPATISSLMMRSRTSDEVSPRLLFSERNTYALPHPRLLTLMSGGSSSDVSSVTSTSRQSLAWEHEFPAPARGANDSLTWEDDPFLESSTSCE